jgi:hypothetical protein
VPSQLGRGRGRCTRLEDSFRSAPSYLLQNVALTRITVCDWGYQNIPRDRAQLAALLASESNLIQPVAKCMRLQSPAMRQRFHTSLCTTGQYTFVNDVIALGCPDREQPRHPSASAFAQRGCYLPRSDIGRSATAQTGIAMAVVYR